MSFILDALRKSEKERKKNQVPDITTVQDIPAGEDRTRVRRFFIVAGGLLAICSIVIIVLLSPADRETATTGLPAAADPSGTRPVAAEPEPNPREVTVPNVSPAVAGSNAKGEGTSTRASVPATSSPVSSAGSEKVVSPPPVTADPQPGGNTVMTGPEKVLPELNITTHIYADHGPSRMVGINGKIFREGQKVADDLIIEQITPEGVVVIFRGQRLIKKIF